MHRPVMQQETATAAARNRRPMAAIVRALERFAVPEKLSSGVFRLVNEFAGIDRLDRTELDETDDDLR